MDPSVQVALVSVFATTITTFGVVLVAVINTQNEKLKAIKQDTNAVGVNHRDIEEVLERLRYIVERLDMVERRLYLMPSTGSNRLNREGDDVPESA